MGRPAAGGEFQGGLEVLPCDDLLCAVDDQQPLHKVPQLPDVAVKGMALQQFDSFGGKLLHPAVALFAVVLDKVRKQQGDILLAAPAGAGR